jgi:hypothetical protein
MALLTQSAPPPYKLKNKKEKLENTNKQLNIIFHTKNTKKESKIYSNMRDLGVVIE